MSVTNSNCAGPSYHYSVDDLMDVSYRDVPVGAYKLEVKDKSDRKKTEVVWYSAIRPKCPGRWRSLPGPVSCAYLLSIQVAKRVCSSWS